MSDNNEFEFFNKKEEKPSYPFHNIQTPEDKVAANMVTVIAIGLVFSVWVLMTAFSKPIQVKTIHPYYNPPVQNQQTKQIPADVKKVYSEQEVGDIVAQIKSEKTIQDNQMAIENGKKSLPNMKEFSQNNSNAPLMGDTSKIKAEDLKKMEEFNKKLMQNSVNQKDIDDTMKALNSAQKSYYQGKIN